MTEKPELIMFGVDADGKSTPYLTQRGKAALHDARAICIEANKHTEGSVKQYAQAASISLLVLESCLEAGGDPIELEAKGGNTE